MSIEMKTLFKVEVLLRFYKSSEIRMMIWKSWPLNDNTLPSGSGHTGTSQHQTWNALFALG